MNTNIKPINSTILQQKGVGLIEVLVSLLLLAVSVLGFIALQTRSAEATSESLVRTTALGIVSDLRDKIRFNISALDDYETDINTWNDNSKSAGTMPTFSGKECGLDKNEAVISSESIVTAKLCTPGEQSAIDSYMAVKEAYDNGFQLGMADCPASVATGEINSKCLIVSWNKTNPKIGATADTDCMNSDGDYHQKADCMIMEIQ